MASVFKKTFTKPLPEGAEVFIRKDERFARWKDGKGKTRTAPVTTGRGGLDRVVIESGTYTAKYRDGQNVVREVATGCRSKDGALSVLKELTDQAERVRSNILSVGEAAIADHQHTPLSEHFTDYLISLESQGTTAEHRENVERCLKRIAADCGFARLSDINRHAVEKWMVARAADEMGARTRNTYRAALVAFCNWCTQDEPPRLLVNPVAKVKKADEKSDRRRQRRAMTAEELRRLIFAATHRPLAEYGRLSVRKDQGDVKSKRGTWKASPLTYDGLSMAVERARKKLEGNPTFVAELERRGRERALIYKTMALTGLRRGELASLTVGSLHLDGPTAYAMLEAADEKNREGSEVPLRADLVEDLRQWIAELAAGKDDAPTVSVSGFLDLPPGTPLFAVPDKLVRVLDRDLKAAGIAKVDDRGWTLDVHALRHSFGTLLSRGGVAPRVAQAAMRHSDIDLTMNVYTDPRLLDVHGALDSLPALPLNSSPESEEIVASATGTEDSTALPLAPMLAPDSDNRSKSGSIADKMTAIVRQAIDAQHDDVSADTDKRKHPLTIPVSGCHGVGDTGLEPVTPSLSSWCSSQLS